VTKEKLDKLNKIRNDEESGRQYLDLSCKQKTHRSKINCLLGNAPQLVSEETYAVCWDLMTHEAEMVLDKLKEELEKS